MAGLKIMDGSPKKSKKKSKAEGEAASPLTPAKADTPVKKRKRDQGDQGTKAAKENGIAKEDSGTKPVEENGIPPKVKKGNDGDDPGNLPKKKTKKEKVMNGTLDINGGAAQGAASLLPAPQTTSNGASIAPPPSASESDPAEGPSSGSEEEDPNALSNFSISDNVKEALMKKGIKSLFPIQAQTFDMVLAGQDLVARARTGQGKTLAFVLPILERLLRDAGSRDGSQRYGRVPRVIVLTPTRELAKQVGSDFELFGEAVKLQTVCVYGGAPMGPQEQALRRGVDVVVGTPGRVKDLLKRGSLSLSQLCFRVLDEADEMLNMGFVDDVEAILGAVKDASQVQTLLFSATLPQWVNKIADRFLKAERKTVDLVGEQRLKASASVKHLLTACHWSQRVQTVTDLISCYSGGGRVIVFTDTKSYASTLANDLAHVGACPLHGDIPQNQRELTLAGFREGAFKVLVATDVAARGLDIPDVQLVIQCGPPKTEETYIHRSGRTGRAGNSGVSVTLVGGKNDHMIPQIERKAGVQFERISAPKSEDVARNSAPSAMESVKTVPDSAVPLFLASAEELVTGTGLPVLHVLAKALAKISGHTGAQQRSLLSGHDGLVALHFKSLTVAIRTSTYVFSVLKRLLPVEVAEKACHMRLTADGYGAVFDVPTDLVPQFLKGLEGESDLDVQSPVTLEVPDILPQLVDRPGFEGPQRSQGGFRHGRGGSGRSMGGRRMGGRGRGGGGRGGGGRGGRGRRGR